MYSYINLSNSWNFLFCTLELSKIYCIVHVLSTLVGGVAPRCRCVVAETRNEPSENFFIVTFMCRSDENSPARRHYGDEAHDSV